MPEFDAYLMVDWSASSTPKTGSDSIWYCLVCRSSGDLSVAALRNPPTRRQAASEIRNILRDFASRHQRVLVGFDFPFGYPAGFADALGLPGTPAWLGTWSEISSRIVDHEDNRNNRFEVAGDLNHRISGTNSPFWGCPVARESATMSCTKGDPGSLAQRRLTDVGNMQPIWKLFGNGSVGSQALLGIPYVTALRNDPALASISRIWPFETGLGKLPGREASAGLIVHAEIYPSLLPVGVTGEVKDTVQVRNMSHHFAMLDGQGELAPLFLGPADLKPDQRERVEQEEGWTLGVCSCSQAPPKLPLQPQARLATPPIRQIDAESSLPDCDFVYFATPASGSAESTKSIVLAAQAIVAHLYNQAGIRMPLIPGLRPGHRILLAYGSAGRYRPLLLCEVCQSSEPVRHGRHEFVACCYIDDAVHDRINVAGYYPDPQVGRFTGISIAPPLDLTANRTQISKPKGNNTLRRWREVFPSPTI